MDVAPLPDLSPAEKRALLADLLRRRIARAGAGVQAADWPLSYGQRAMWLLQQLEPDSPVFVVAFAARMAALPDLTAFRQAVQALLDRHPVLTCAFPLRNGAPAPTVGAHADADLAVVDARGWSAEEVRARVLDAAHRPFDLERDPLVRVRLFDAADGVTMLWTVHHIITDLRSLQVLLVELSALYAAARGGVPAALPATEADYGDFARWQAELLAGPDGARLWGYWRDRLAGEPPALDLPADRPRPPARSSRGATRPFALDAGLARRLRDFARAEGMTLYTVLLAAFEALLHRWASQDDLLVGSPVAARGRPEFAHVAGYFANMVVLRADLSGDPSFRALLGRTRQDVLGALEHQDFPFALLVERLQPARDPSRPPLFQAAFALQQASALEQRIDLGGLALEPIDLERRAVDFELALTLREEGEALRGFLQFSTDLFEPATADRLIDHYRTVLVGALDDPGRPVSELPLTGGDELRRVVDEWNATTAPWPLDRPAHVLVAEQAARTPDAVAVRHEARAWTYRELDERSDRIARRLHGRGVGPDVIVALCAERSFELIAGLLGVLKAGGAYLPLDPTHPPERLAVLLADARPRAILSQRWLRDRLPAEGAVLDLDDDSDCGCANGALPSLTPDHLAYVIYTSGSTGAPKGVMVPQRGLTNYTQAARGNFHLTPADRLLQFAALTFDAHVEEIFPCLTSGATLVLRTDALLDSAAAFGRLCAQWGVTVASLPTAFWHELVSAPDDPAAVFPPALRLLVLGGERVQPDRLARWRQRVGGRVRLLNTYGPTEATVVATAADLTDFAEPGEAPIGRPIANARAYVLDRRLRPVPVGVPGELCLAGAGLARGYLGRPELTTERFVTTDLAGRAERVYRTGDRVRWRADGQLEFLGRLDAQVKVRGFRVEPAEIEAVLAAHPDVREAAVVARADGGATQLVGYITAANGHPPPPADLRDFLRGRLPDFMVPAAFVAVPALPRTSGGKVDRRRLPAAPAPAESRRPFVEPRTPTERALADVWREVLRADRIGADDNFFELGGHSLLAVQIVSRVRARLGVEFPLREVFEEPTVANLAARIDAARSATPPLAPIPRAARGGGLPASFSQERLWFLDRIAPGNPAYNMPAAIRLTGLLDPEALRQALQAVADRHDALRTTFAERDGQPVQVVAPALAVAIPVIDLSQRLDAEREAEMRRRAAEEARRPFDLARGPLLRASLLRLGEREHVLLVALHHIVADGWSVAVLVGEALAHYAAVHATGAPAPLPELPIQFADYAVWQRDVLEKGDLDEALGWWTDRLAGLPRLELPTDRPRPPVQTYRGETMWFDLPADVARGVRAVGERAGATPFMTLLAAFQTLLGQRSGQDDFPVGTLVAGRGRAELEGLIGFFVNTLVLRADLSGRPSFRELLRRVRESTVGAFAHTEAPFAQVVEGLRPPRDPSRSPLFQVLFVLQNTPPVPPPGPEMRAELLAVDPGTARFDLTLDLVDEGEGFRGRWEFNTDLFDAATVRRLHDDWLTVLTAALADPDRPLAELPVPAAAERRHERNGRNGTPADASAHRRLAERPAAYVAPRTAAERTLAGLWAEVLGVGRVGVHDNFFALGGASLPALRLVSRARAAGLPLDPLDPFLHQTIAEQAAAVDEHGRRSRRGVGGGEAGVP